MLHLATFGLLAQVALVASTWLVAEVVVLWRAGEHMDWPLPDCDVCWRRRT